MVIVVLKWSCVGGVFSLRKTQRFQRSNQVCNEHAAVPRGPIFPCLCDGAKTVPGPERASAVLQGRALSSGQREKKPIPQTWTACRHPNLPYIDGAILRGESLRDKVTIASPTSWVSGNRV